MARCLLILLSLPIFSGCIGYSVRTRAHTMSQAPSFTLPATDGRKWSVGKPWRGVTILTFIRGQW